MSARHPDRLPPRADPPPGFVRVPHPRRPDRALFHYDPRRQVVEVKPKGEEAIRVDLTQYAESGKLDE